MLVGEDVGGPSGGEDSSSAAPVDLGRGAAPALSAVRNGETWRVSVSLTLEVAGGRWITSIRLLAGELEIGERRFERPEPGGIAMPIVARFDVPLATESVVAVVTDDQGRSWKTSWKLS